MNHRVRQLQVHLFLDDRLNVRDLQRHDCVDNQVLDSVSSSVVKFAEPLLRLVLLQSQLRVTDVEELDATQSSIVNIQTLGNLTH